MEPTYEIKNYDDLNKFLAGVLKDVRRGVIKGDTACAISVVADKINKNNVNRLQYQKQIDSKDTIDFFENEK